MLLLQQTSQIYHYKSWNYYSFLCMKNTSMKEIKMYTSLLLSLIFYNKMNYLLNVQPKLAPLNPTTNVNAKDNNNNQAVNAPFDEDEFINPFFTPIHKVAKSSSCNVDTSNMHTFYQRHRSDYHWTRDHPLEQVHGYPSKPVQTR
ncbi:hypothetical protein Tco_0995260 [Tanacetum coccineum]